MTLDSWRPHRYGEGRKLRGEALKIADMEGKWYGVEDIDKPILVKGVY